MFLTRHACCPTKVPGFARNWIVSWPRSGLSNVFCFKVSAAQHRRWRARPCDRQASDQPQSYGLGHGLGPVACLEAREDVVPKVSTVFSGSADIDDLRARSEGKLRRQTRAS